MSVSTSPEIGGLARGQAWLVQQRLLAAALNELVALHREKPLASHSTGDHQRLAQTRDEVTRLGAGGQGRTPGRDRRP
jgi:hypothetical protein